MDQKRALMRSDHVTQTRLLHFKMQKDSHTVTEALVLPTATDTTRAHDDDKFIVNQLEKPPKKTSMPSDMTPYGEECKINQEKVICIKASDLCTQTKGITDVSDCVVLILRRLS